MMFSKDRCVYGMVINDLFSKLFQHNGNKCIVCSSCCCCCSQVASVRSDSLQTYELQPASLLCPWNSLGKNIGVGCHALLQGIFPFQGLNSSCMSPALAGGFFTTSAAWEAPICSCAIMKLLSFVNLCKLNKDTYIYTYICIHTNQYTLSIFLQNGHTLTQLAFFVFQLYEQLS